MPLHFWVFVGCVIGNFIASMIERLLGSETPTYGDAVERTFFQGSAILAVWIAEQIPQQ